jgi:hypothetical protein
VEFELDIAAIAANAQPGDQLVLRFTTTGGPDGTFYVPNGDGTASGGRDPSLTLPH